jgi:uncharacterized protein (TIGR02996 family)
MTPEHAFLDSIWEDLDDDATKLIFADWLEEQEDWRGQLLRWQVERNQHGFWTREFKGLNRKILDHLLELGDTWLQPLEQYQEIRYSDGTGLLWLRMAPDDLAKLPEPRTSEGVHRWITEVSLEGRYLNDVLKALERGPHVRLFLNFAHRTPDNVGQRLAASPALERVRSLDLTYGELHSKDLETLLASPRLEPLQYLFLGFSSGVVAVPQALAAATHLVNLRGLDLCACHLRDEALDHLSRAPALDGLTALYLERNQFGVPGLESLTASRHLDGLRILDLRSCGISADWPAAVALRQRFPFAQF